MKSLLRYYNSICVPKYQRLGFSKRNMTLARIYGDTLQVFSLKCFRNTSICSVDFGIIPLCMPGPIFLEAGGYNLDMFDLEHYAKHAGWIYDSKSNESIVSCIQAVSNTIDIYLLPILERCRDCKTTLSELISLEELFDCHRKRALALQGDLDFAVPWQERSLFDSRKYYMALKSRSFDYARKYLNHQINFYKNELDLLDKPGSPKQPPIVRAGFLSKLETCKEQLQWIDAGEFSNLEDLLNSNEIQMRKFLLTKFSLV